MSSEDKPLQETPTLQLKDPDKYKDLLEESLETYKEGYGYGEGNEEPVLEIKIDEPWSIGKLKIFGSLWFSMVIFLLLGNFLIAGYYHLAQPVLMEQEEARLALERNHTNLNQEFMPFERFLALNSEVTDREYTSFLQALNDLNTYFPRNEFQRGALFKEDDFSFEGQGIYYTERR